MIQRVKVGNVYVDLPKGSSTTIELAPADRPVKAEKPEVPEALEEQQYIYRPNDPFRSYIDEARAIGSIRASHKPWIKKAWFIIFLVGPLAYAELGALSSALNDKYSEPWQAFIGANLFILPIWLTFYSIWRRKVKR